MRRVVEMENLSDQQLIKLVLKGEKDAFSVLVMRYQKQIYSLTYRFTNNPEDARDLAQEIFIHLYRVLPKYDGKRNFFSWMYKVASNVCCNALRREKQQQTFPLDKVINFSPLTVPRDIHPEEYYERREMRELVRQAVAELPDKYRLPIILRYMEDLSYREIAEILDLPITTIETRLYRGKALLQKRLHAKGEGGPVHEVSRL